VNKIVFLPGVSCGRLAARVAVLAVMLGAASSVFCQTPTKPAGAAPKASPANPTASPKAGGSPPSLQEQQQFQAKIVELQSRIGRAAEGPMSQIADAENELYIRFAYFKKPERLDPTNFGSKDELQAWQNSLGELKTKEANVEKLYATASDALFNALTQQRITYSLADQIRKELVKSFPWDTIQKKEILMQQFIDAHGELLTLYDKNWGSWKSGGSPGHPVFDDPQLQSGFTKLCDKINSSGRQIEDLYTKIKQQ
jgi:hypothetical protein